MSFHVVPKTRYLVRTVFRLHRDTCLGIALFLTHLIQERDTFKTFHIQVIIDHHIAIPIPSIDLTPLFLQVSTMSSLVGHLVYQNIHLTLLLHLWNLNHLHHPEQRLSTILLSNSCSK